MLALVRAKRQEFLDELDVDDPRTLMTTKGSRWDRVVVSVNIGDGVTCYRSAKACKYKWQQLLPDYKRIGDVHKESGTNSEAYFMMTVAARRVRSLPTNFDLYLYHEMHEWLKHKPTMTPPHFRDLMNPDDHNFQPAFRNAPIDLEEASVDQVPLDNSTVHAYTSATAHDSVIDCGEDSGMHPVESEALPTTKEVHSSFPTPPPCSPTTAPFPT